MATRSTKKDIFAAVRAGKHTILRNFLDCGGDANAVDPACGESLLGIAAQKGDLNAGKLLLDHGASPNRATFAWPIHFAAGAGHLSFVELLLDHDSEVHCLDEEGGTPLADAAAGGHLSIVEALLEAGADPTYRDRYGKRPIMYAAEKGHGEIVKLLAPHSSARERRAVELKFRFAGKGRPREEVTQFHIAANRGDLERVRQYIERGGDPNAVSICGSTALMSAANCGRIEVLSYLLGVGSDPNLVDEDGASALNYATYDKVPDAYELLYPLTNEKLRRSADRAKEKKVKAGLWK